MTTFEYDAVIVGSGFGGSMIAKKLSENGWKVAIIERGDWIQRGPENWDVKNSIDLTPSYDKSIPYHVLKGGNKKQMGIYTAVGGPSVFYGGVSFRFREKDFTPNEDMIDKSDAEWPINYNDLEKYYDDAEKILNIAGESGIDPTEPHRNFDFPQQPKPLAEISKKIKSSAQSLGLHPFHLPLAIDSSTCVSCTTCDTFACAVSAKNDLDSMFLRKAHSQKQLEIFSNTLAYKINYTNDIATSVLSEHTKNGSQFEHRAKVIIIAAGALASPHLLLNSDLDKINPAGHIIGRYLMRHVNAIVFGVFPGVADKQYRFHKELAIMDFYFGNAGINYPKFKIGSLQQVPTPPKSLVENALPFPLGAMISQGVKLISGLLAIAEDQPQYENYIYIDKSKITDKKLAVPFVTHEYSKRDIAAINALINEAKKIMKKSGALFNYVHHIRTFSHAAGTVRMGVDESTSPLDKNCNFRGLHNLFVVDACFMPTSAAVNPSLTIAANALRVGDHIIDKFKLK